MRMGREYPASKTEAPETDNAAEDVSAPIPTLPQENENVETRASKSTRLSMTLFQSVAVRFSVPHALG